MYFFVQPGIFGSLLSSQAQFADEIVISAPVSMKAGG
jgi:hypothetical protein